MISTKKKGTYWGTVGRGNFRKSTTLLDIRVPLFVFFSIFLIRKFTPRSLIFRPPRKLFLALSAEKIFEFESLNDRTARKLKFFKKRCSYSTTFYFSLFLTSTTPHILGSTTPIPPGATRPACPSMERK